MTIGGVTKPLGRGALFFNNIYSVADKACELRSQFLIAFKNLSTDESLNVNSHDILGYSRMELGAGRGDPRSYRTSNPNPA
jgi:hypothetical protein